MKLLSDFKRFKENTRLFISLNLLFTFLTAKGFVYAFLQLRRTALQSQINSVDVKYRVFLHEILRVI